MTHNVCPRLAFSPSPVPSHPLKFKWNVLSHGVVHSTPLLKKGAVNFKKVACLHHEWFRESRPTLQTGSQAPAQFSSRTR